MASLVDLKDAILQYLLPNISAFYEQYLPAGTRFKQDSPEGWSNRVLCPIHGDANTPQFFINLRTGGFKCHACKAGGSVFDFWMLKNGVDPKDTSKFRDALVAVANFAHFDIGAFDKTAASRPAMAAASTAQTKVSTGKKGELGADFLPKLCEADETDRVNKPIEPALIKVMQAALEPKHVQFLAMKRGLTKRTIERYRIGWDVNAYVKDAETGEFYKGRFSIPIPNKVGEFRNVRLYSNRAGPEAKMINFVLDKKKATERRFGKPARLFNLHELLTGHFEHIVFCEGEWDCILLNQMFEASNYQSWIAVTGTHGVNKFQPEWVQYFLGKHVYICVDCDARGKIEAPELASNFFLRPMQAGKIPSLRIVTLPLEGSKELKDISDYFLKCPNTCDQFVKLCVETPEVIAGGLENDDASIKAIEVADFVSAIKDRRYIDQKITVPIAISGATSKIYHAIRSYKVTYCPLAEKSSQAECCADGVGERTIPYGHPLFIEACMEREGSVIAAITRIACDKGEKCKITAMKKVVMEEYFANQVIIRWRAEEGEDGRFHNTQELIQTSVYILQPPNMLDIEPQNYQATGWIRTHPKTCVATFFIESLVPMEEDWKKFTMESRDNLELIQEIKKLTMDDLIGQIVQGVTKIYEADDILYSVLLTYLSPLSIKFNGSLLRGWLNCAIIGDSGTGKSATYVRFSDWIELGDLFSALSGTRTGLLYAIKKKGEEWYVSIGRYVQANGKIIAVDETQETDPAEIKRMAVAMDTGYLKVDQVASGGYHTKTRTIFLLNPKDFRGKAATISDFANGCEALRMCFDPMFIRRLDLAVFTAGKHKYEFYNQYTDGEKKTISTTTLTPKMMRALIYWAWTRKPNQIFWSEAATRRCLEKAVELSKEYGDADQIPLVNPQDFRENLARVSSAYAILDRNFTEDLESVHVETRHVEAMAQFIDILYSSPACNLKQQSKQARQKNNLDDFKRIDETFRDVINQNKNSTNPYYANSNPFCQMLLIAHQVGTVRQGDLAEQIGVNRTWIQKRLAVLQSFNLVEITRFGYKVTRKFNLFMREWMADHDIAKMLEGVHEEIGRYALLRGEPAEQPVNTEEEQYIRDPFA